jgi:hypothetical protein
MKNYMIERNLIIPYRQLIAIEYSAFQNYIKNLNIFIILLLLEVNIESILGAWPYLLPQKSKMNGKGKINSKSTDLHKCTVQLGA